MPIISEAQPELYVARQSFTLARNVLMSTAEKAKKQVILLCTGDEIHHVAMAQGTEITDPGIQSCILALIEWLPSSFVPEVEKSLAEVLRKSTQ